MTARLPRTSLRQFELMVQYFEENKDFASGKITENYTVQDRSQHWKKLSDILNADGSGPVKDIKKWIKTWVDYKSAVRAKYARICVHRKRAGSDEGQKDFLNPLEERVLNIIRHSKTMGHMEFRDSDVSDVPDVTSFEEGAVSDSESKASVAEVPVSPSQGPVISFVTAEGSTSCEEGVGHVNVQNGDVQSHQTNIKKGRSERAKRPAISALFHLRRAINRNNDLLCDCSRSLRSIEACHERLSSAQERMAAAFERNAAAEERKATALEEIVQIAKILASE